jgi:dihydroneopterin aldolase
MEQMEKMDQIKIQGLIFEAGIGAYDWEQNILQQVEIDLCIYTDTRKAGNSDELNDAIDYFAVGELIRNVLKDHHFQLIEAMANAIARQLLSVERIEKLRITVAKPGALRNARTVSVRLERSRADYL